VIIVLAVRGVPDLTMHDHLCFVYDQDVDVRQALLEYALTGLARRERVCVFSMPGAASAEIEADLSARGLPVADLVARGMLVLASAEHAYPVAGFLAADQRLTGYVDAVQTALAGGHTGLRVYVETQLLLAHPDVLAAWPAYELRIDVLVKQLPLTAVCAYDARRWTANNLVLAATVHTQQSRELTTFRLHAGRDGALRLSGELDFLTANHLYRLVVRTAPTRPSAVLDLSGIRFMDVTGARTIGTACEAIAGRHGPTVLRGASPLLRRIWAPATWSEIFPHVIIED
jgi:anti-anti-sigma factor